MDMPQEAFMGEPAMKHPREVAPVASIAQSALQAMAVLPRPSLSQPAATVLDNKILWEGKQVVLHAWHQSNAWR